MPDLAIRVENLGKLYSIGAMQERHDTLRDALADFRKRLIKPGKRKTESEQFWALRDVSFEIKHGEVVGVIGRNGAGKSTLLKILSRITEPTTGYAEIYGRVGSLLEVGTGFHPELTGRENIYFNGAILGMHRAEIDRKFDEIVAFSEIEKFLDTPVKRYSSGMYVRLAFAVAAHLEPEILLVDEVLAVGDVKFQRKCLGKMDDVARDGRTILFISHNMSAIQRLCKESILLDQGQVVLKDKSTNVVGLYTSSGVFTSTPMQWMDLGERSRVGTGEVTFRRARYAGLLSTGASQPCVGCPLDFQLEIWSDAPRSVGSLAVTLYNDGGVKLVNADTLAQGREIMLDRGLNKVRLRIQELHLNEGVYIVGLWLANPGSNVMDHIENAFRIQVVSPEIYEFGVKPPQDGLVTCAFDVIREP